MACLTSYRQETGFKIKVIWLQSCFPVQKNEADSAGREGEIK